MDDILSVNTKSASFERLIIAKEDEELKEIIQKLRKVDSVRCNIIKRELASRKERRKQFSKEFIDEWNQTTQELHKKLTGE